MFKLQIKDFDLQQIALSGQCFTHTRLDDYKYGICSGNNYVQASQKDDIVTFSCDEQEFNDYWYEYFAMSYDYAAIKNSVDENDEYLSAAIKYGHGIRVLKQELWDTMVCFMISQNNHIGRIQKSVNAIIDNFGVPMTTKDGLAYKTFPQPIDMKDATEADFTEMGLGYRANYMTTLVKNMLADDGQFLENIKTLDDNTAHKELMKIHGIGKKVADCVSLYGLNRINRFPIDTHIKQILDNQYKDGFPYDRYDGYLGIIQQYLFYYKRSL